MSCDPPRVPPTLLLRQRSLGSSGSGSGSSCGNPQQPLRPPHLNLKLSVGHSSGCPSGNGTLRRAGPGLGLSPLSRRTTLDEDGVTEFLMGGILVDQVRGGEGTGVWIR